MGVPHLSCYALTVEKGTALDKMISRHRKAPVDQERQASQFMLLMDWMEQAGYEHYEISNFALPGMRSRHNSSYWQGKNYHGFGPSAHSYDGARRRWNVSNNAAYIRSLQEGKIPFEEELLTRTQQLNEYIMTSLRTSEGLDLEFVERQFGETHIDRLRRSANKYLQDGKLETRGTQYILTREGKLFADGIAADLFC
jgi:oxygen-independent coproporphyrinogen-3 oxidase